MKLDIRILEKGIVLVYVILFFIMGNVIVKEEKIIKYKFFFDKLIVEKVKYKERDVEFVEMEVEL